MSKLANNVLFSLDSALQIKNNVNVETIAAHKGMDYQDAQYQIITNNSGAPLEVRLPGFLADVAVKTGVAYWVRCAGSDNLTIQGGGGATITSLTSGQSGLFVADSTNWQLIFKG